ncbi:tetratricopeptide repeat protein [Kitasatospora purpeofusca]|uniref:tetratricopeptide repeat protein n=1 Tax=Kitasatospora purpeofusca TaxID=67352 RepID=UPI0035D8D51C
MERARLVGVGGPGGPGSGYVLGGRLVLTSAHVVARDGQRVEVFHPGGDGTLRGGTVVWCGTPGGRDDAALVLVDDGDRRQAPVPPVRWGRMVTDRPGTDCETWGVPDVVQRPGQAVEVAQLTGKVNPGSGFVNNQYVMDLLQHPPQWSADHTSPWGGMSGAAVFCDRLLAGVVASDRAHSAHGQLNVVPGYVLHLDPSFRAALAEHGGDVQHLEAVEFQNLADVEVEPPVDGLVSPAALLRAELQTVPFHGRGDLLDELTAWCARGGFGAWLLHGPGGQGKTRLAQRLAALLAADRWAVLWPRQNASPDRLLEIRHAAKPLLVVLDYAEIRTGQLAAVVEAAAEHPRTTPLKLLLLARTDGDWWARAKTSTRLAEHYLDTAPARLLPPLEDRPADRPRAYHDAAHALAVALPRVRGCGGYDWPAVVRGLPVPRLDQDGYANALTLHMTALADLLDAAAPAGDGGPAPASGRVEGADGVEDRLLHHERRYWHGSAAVRGLEPALTPDALETAVAAAHQVGAADREQADRTWHRLPVLTGQARDRRNAVTAWIAALYPPTEAQRPWGGFQPDRLAERHIGRTLDGTPDDAPDLAEHLLQDADDAQLDQLLTVYSRAASHPVFHGRLDARLTRLCTRHHRRLAGQIIATATRTDHPGPLVAALDALADDPATPLDGLIDLDRRMPDSSSRLADTAVRLTRTLTNRHLALAAVDPETYLPGLAGSLTNLSVSTARLGRRAEALAAAEEAVRIRRMLAGTDPVAWAADLAHALNNLSVELGEVGRREEALTVIEEAVGIRRVLAGADPGAHLRGLAMSLGNLALRLGELGRPEEELAAAEEALGIRRGLAAAEPEARPADLAAALERLFGSLREVGRRAEALEAIQEAVRHHRTLADGLPDVHLPGLAMVLGNLATGLGEVGRRAEALEAIQEALRHYQVLADGLPDTYLPYLANCLDNLAIRLAEVGRRAEALEAGQEAVRHYRTLAGRLPDAHLPGLATSLDHLSARLGETGRHEEALSVAREAVGIHRRLAGKRPDVQRPYLASSLDNLSLRWGELGRWQDGLAAAEEALGIRRVLAGANSEAYLPDLALSLSNLSVGLGAVGRRPEGLPLIEEAVAIRRALAGADPEMYLPDFALSLNNLSVSLRETGRPGEALTAAEEALGIRRVLAGSDPGTYLPDLGTSLNNLSLSLGDAGRPGEALTAAEEALGIRRVLAGADPGTYLPDLGSSLNNLSLPLWETGRREEALAVAGEAVAVRRRLAAAGPAAHLAQFIHSLNNLALLSGAADRPEAASAAIREAVDRHRELAVLHPALSEEELRKTGRIAAWLVSRAR